jgi:hypothetical protein
MVVSIRPVEVDPAVFRVGLSSVLLHLGGELPLVGRIGA